MFKDVGNRDLVMKSPIRNPIRKGPNKISIMQLEQSASQPVVYTELDKNVNFNKEEA